MKRFTLKSSPLYYFILPLAIFFLFKKKVDDILLTTIVAPIFSFVSPASKIYDFIIIGLIVFGGYLLRSKIVKGATIALKWQLISLSIIVIYGTYRFGESLFDFTPFSIISSLKLLDAFAIFIIFVCVFNYLYKAVKQKKSIREDISGFTADEPTIISKENDLLKRGKFIEHIASTVSKTNSKRGSFPIGIVAPWGSGKTTFMDTLKVEMDKRNFVTIELNLWKCSSPEQIISAVFKLLAENLQQYSLTLNNSLGDYAKTLIKESSSGLIGSFFEKVFTEPSVEKQFEKIKKEVIRIDKKILVLIDDIDRLDKKEIYEVIRLVRNTANFPNIFFIVAYDRNYILNAIEEINPYQSHTFLEKIFQLEFTLPPIESSILQNELEIRLGKILTDRSKECYKEFLRKHKYDSFSNYGQLDLTSTFIINMRDVVRFINSFMTSYHFVKDEIFFPDFYNLELIRFKHPEIFAEFYRRYDDFVTTMDDNFKDHFTYFLSRKTADKRTYLEEFLMERKRVYKIEEKELLIIVNSLNLIFYTKSNEVHFSSSSGGINSHLTVVNPSTFDRYFRLGIEGLLSEVEFSDSRQLPKLEFLKNIKKSLS